MSPQVKEAMRLKVLAECWRRGNLRYQFHSTQEKMTGAFEACPERRFFLLCSRRLGKSRMLLTLAFELAIQRGGSRIFSRFLQFL